MKGGKKVEWDTLKRKGNGNASRVIREQSQAHYCQIITNFSVFYGLKLEV